MQLSGVIAGRVIAPSHGAVMIDCRKCAYRAYPPSGSLPLITAVHTWRRILWTTGPYNLQIKDQMSSRSSAKQYSNILISVCCVPEHWIKS